jgi:carbamoyltransferase
MITWGIVANSHDASIAAFDNSNLKWAGLAKDFSGITHDADLNSKLINEAVRTVGYPDRIVWYEQPFKKTMRQLWAGQGWLGKENNIKRYLAAHQLDTPIKYTQHHLSHAAYAYYTQPHDNCAVICLDSIGEFETLTVWHGRNNQLKKLHSQRYPHSLGLFYSAMTQRLGLTPQQDEYLVADMAKGGNPLRFWKDMCTDIVDIDQDARNPHIRMRTNLHRGCTWWRPDISTEQDLRDLAATTQEIFCWSVKILSNWAHWRTGSKHLALAGGGALNRDAINRISGDWDAVWVPPQPGDPGSAVGCVLAHTQQRIDNVDKFWHQC